MPIQTQNHAISNIIRIVNNKSISESIRYAIVKILIVSIIHNICELFIKPSLNLCVMHTGRLKLLFFVKEELTMILWHFTRCWIISRG